MTMLLASGSKGVDRNFSMAGLSEAPGEGSPAIFQIPGGAQPQCLVASMVKMKEFRGQGWGNDPPCLCLPTPMASATHLPGYDMKKCTCTINDKSMISQFCSCIGPCCYTRVHFLWLDLWRQDVLCRVVSAERIGPWKPHAWQSHSDIVHWLWSAHM